MRTVGWLVLIVALIALAALGLALRDSELVKPWSASAEADRTRMETEQAAKQAEFERQAAEAREEVARRQAELDLQAQEDEQEAEHKRAEIDLHAYEAHKEAELRAYQAQKEADRQYLQAQREQQLWLRGLLGEAGVHLLKFVGSVLSAVLAAVLGSWLWRQIRRHEAHTRAPAHRPQQEGQARVDALRRAREERLAWRCVAEERAAALKELEALRQRMDELEGQCVQPVGTDAGNNGHADRGVIYLPDRAPWQGGTRK